MNQKQADDMASATVSLLKEIIDPLKARNAELETRIKQLESRPLLKYAGVHVEGQPCAEAQLVTKAGGLYRPDVHHAGHAWELVAARCEARAGMKLEDDLHPRYCRHGTTRRARGARRDRGSPRRDRTALRLRCREYRDAGADASGPGPVARAGTETIH